jgi:hypothetical protein
MHYNDIILSDNIYLYVPFCCEKSIDKSQYQQKIVDIITTIKKTKIGQQIFHEIASSPHKIFCSTHPLSQPCGTNSVIDGMVSPRSIENSQLPGVGSDVDLYFFLPDHFVYPKLYTEFYHEISDCLGITEFAKKHLFSTVKATKERIFFHELCHAYRYLKGLNQTLDYGVPKIYNNREEYETIQLENQFITEIETTKGNRFLSPYLRYGHVTPTTRLQVGNEANTSSLSRLNVKVIKSDDFHPFLRIGIPQLILSLGKTPNERSEQRPILTSWVRDTFDAYVSQVESRIAMMKKESPQCLESFQKICVLLKEVSFPYNHKDKLEKKLAEIAKLIDTDSIKDLYDDKENYLEKAVEMTMDLLKSKI